MGGIWGLQQINAIYISLKKIARDIRNVEFDPDIPPCDTLYISHKFVTEN